LAFLRLWKPGDPRETGLSSCGEDGWLSCCVSPGKLSEKASCLEEMGCVLGATGRGM
jgi:hypothetical protein